MLSHRPTRTLAQAPGLAVYATAPIAPGKSTLPRCAPSGSHCVRLGAFDGKRILVPNTAALRLMWTQLGSVGTTFGHRAGYPRGEAANRKSGRLLARDQAALKRPSTTQRRVLSDCLPTSPSRNTWPFKDQRFVSLFVAEEDHDFDAAAPWVSCGALKALCAHVAVEFVAFGFCEALERPLGDRSLGVAC